MTQVEGKKMGGGAAMPSEPLCQSKNYWLIIELHDNNNNTVMKIKLPTTQVTSSQTSQIH
jgi:hypothetical protein